MARRGLPRLKKLLPALAAHPKRMRRFLRDYRQWQRSAPAEWRADPGELKWRLEEADEEAGSASGHYFLQDLWAAQRVHAFAPDRHIDVGSRVDGFVAHVASFCPVEYVDLRPMDVRVPGITGRVGDIADLPYDDDSVASLSCLHVVEHIGLGRYGDPIDPEGWRSAVAGLQRVLAPGGQLLFSTPIGRQRVIFHAHRVFDPLSIIDAFDQLDLAEFSLIPDNRAIAWQEDADPTACSGLTYGCGLFRFRKPDRPG